MTYTPGVQRPGEKGIANGYAELDAAGLVPVARLPVFGPSGVGHAAGAVPDPGPTDDGVIRGLREDGVWAALPNQLIQTPVQDQNATTGTIVYERGKLFAVTALMKITATGTSGEFRLYINWTDPTNTIQTEGLFVRTITTLTTQAESRIALIATKDPGLGSFSWYTEYTGTKGSVALSWYIGVRVVSTA